MNPLLTTETLTVLTAIVLIGGTWLSWRSASGCRTISRAGAALLRAAALGCLLLIAWNPGSWEKKGSEEDSVWAILVDRSKSMATEDVSGQSRWQAAARTMESFDASVRDNARLFTFADSLKPEHWEDVQELEPDGESTRINRSCSELLNMFESGSTRLGGIILASDGRTLVPKERSAFYRRARAREVPVYTAVLGEEVKLPDISLNVGRQHWTAFKDQPVNLSVRIKNTGFPPQRLKLTLKGKDDTIRKERTVDVETDATKSVSLEVAFSREGYQPLVLSVEALDGEKDIANNSAEVGVNVLSEPMRVYIAEGLPHWDTKFLTQLIRKQPSLEVTAVYRVAENRFFRVDTADPSEGTRVENIFPDTMEELNTYDIVIFGKGIKYILNPERTGMLWTFISEHGGNVIFSRSKPYSGSFPELERIEPVDWGERSQIEARLRPTVSGEHADLFGSRLPRADARVWDELQQITVQHECRSLRSFSRVLAKGAYGDQSTVPVIISRRIGTGLVVTVNAAEMWKWEFFPAESEAARIYGSLWAQLAQWVTTYSQFLPGQRLSIEAQPERLQVDEPCHIVVRDRPAGGRTSIEPRLHLFREEQLVSKVSLSRSEGKSRSWETVIHPEKSGNYLAEIYNARTDQPVGDARVTIKVDPPPSEQDKLSADPDFMQKLAGETGGRPINLSEIPGIVTAKDQSRKTSKAETVWVPAWPNAWLLTCIALCFAGEWIIRRRSGLL